MSRPLRDALTTAAAVVAIGLLLALPFPDLAARAGRRWIGGLGDVAAIVPTVLLLIALFDAWVPKALVQRGLGPRSGARGVALALLLGAAAAGPLYAAFPIGVALREKGARTANLVVFLGAWATIKLPMLMMESAFLGTRFALLRLALTLPGLVAAGFLMEALLPPAAPAPVAANGD